jgi:nucleoside-diphosphate-sugar epimerase
LSVVVVTGASGFIGRQVLASLKGTPYDVVAVARRGRSDLTEAVEWRTLDLMRQGAADELFASVKPDALMHLAWGAGSPTYRTDEANRLWADASSALVSSFYRHGGRRVIFAGTSAEHQPDGARSLYARSKIQAVEAMLAHARSAGGSFAWGRIFLPYGPYDAPHRLIPEVVSALLAGRVTHCSPGSQIRDFVYVSDVADAMVDLLRSEREGPVDIGTGVGSSVRHVAETIGRLTGRPELLRFDGPRPQAGEPEVLVADAGILATFGRRARALDEGLGETIAWHKMKGAA